MPWKSFDFLGAFCSAAADKPRQIASPTWARPNCTCDQRPWRSPSIAPRVEAAAPLPLSAARSSRKHVPHHSPSAAAGQHASKNYLSLPWLKLISMIQMCHNTSLFCLQFCFSLTSSAGCKHMPRYSWRACKYVRLQRNITSEWIMTMTLYYLYSSRCCFVFQDCNIQNNANGLGWNLCLLVVLLVNVFFGFRGSVVTLSDLLCVLLTHKVQPLADCACAFLCVEMFTSCSISSSGQWIIGPSENEKEKNNGSPWKGHCPQQAHTRGGPHGTPSP